jgi:serine phosphatase RsbU (regulator of sigma subunit)
LVANVPLGEIVSSANAFLCRKVAGQKYATLFLCRISKDGEMEYLNCGHVPPVLVENTNVERPSNCNLPVGLLSDAQYTAEKVQLKPNQKLVIVTDGVTEAENANGDFYGDETLEQAAHATEPFDNIFASLRGFCGETPFNDDCTVVEVTYKGA